MFQINGTCQQHHDTLGGTQNNMNAKFASFYFGGVKATQSGENHNKKK